MFSYNKFLEYPVKIKNPNPRLANIVIMQYGGPYGELGASLRYLSQRYTMPDDVTKGLLTDIGTSCSKQISRKVLQFRQNSDIIIKIINSGN